MKKLLLSLMIVCSMVLSLGVLSYALTPEPTPGPVIPPEPVEPTEKVLDHITVSKTNTIYANMDKVTADALSDVTVTAHYKDTDWTDDVTEEADCLYSINKESNTITFKYSLNEVTKECSLKIKTVKDLEVTKTKTSYFEGEEDDVLLSDITVKVKYNDDTLSSALTSDDYEIAYVKADKKVTVTYTLDGVTFTKDIALTFNKVLLSKITATKVKTNYEVNEEVKLDDITITCEYNNGSSKQLLDDTNVTKTLYKDLITISYTEGGVTKEVKLYVKIPGVKSVKEIRATKDQTDYDYDEDIDTDDIVVRVYYSDGTSKKVTDDCKFTVDEDDEEIEVRYKEDGEYYYYTIDLDIASEKSYIKKIVATKKVTTYYNNEEIDYDDIEVKAYMYSSPSKAKDVTDDCTFSLRKNIITVKYKYKGDSATDTIELKILDEDKPNSYVVSPVKFKQMKLHIGESSAIVDGIYKPLDTAPVIRNNRTMLPIRFIAEQLGAQVEWNAIYPYLVKITKGTQTMYITIGSNIALINGYEYELDQVAFTENNRTYLPVRFISEHLGANVYWYATNPNEVIIQAK